MKLFTCRQIAEIDRMTMQLEPIASIDLMERAAHRVSEWIIQHFSNDHIFYIFAGPGNNGGDAFAVARILAENHYTCSIFWADFDRELKDDAAINLSRLTEQNKVLLKKINARESIPEIPAEAIILDGLFGSGLNKPLTGLPKEIVQQMNQSRATIISIDIPSGLFGEDNSGNDLSGIVQAQYTLTFQFPKLSFFFPENVDFVGDWNVLPILLHPEAILRTESKYFSLAKTFISGILKKRGKFSHKGNFGHALLIAGSYGKMGAAVLASRACLRAGVGLLTSHVPRSGYPIIQNSVPEAMTSIDSAEEVFTEFPAPQLFSAVGIGPGLGKSPETQEALKKLLQSGTEKLIIDADGLNILADNKEWLGLLPENTILTPHPKEFERMAGKTSNSYERFQKQLQFSVTHKIIIVLKGANTCISVPDGSAFFNETGNPGMATAGSGDVLTGIILGLLAQNYTPEEAALIGVYLHGLAGDLSVSVFGQQALIAGDIINHMGAAFLHLE
jgi:NAD(P)H-hydrate epimerase